MLKTRDDETEKTNENLLYNFPKKKNLIQLDVIIKKAY